MKKWLRINDHGTPKSRIYKRHISKERTITSVTGINSLDPQHFKIFNTSTF